MITCGLLTGMLKAGQSPVFRKPDVVVENTLSFKIPFRKEEQLNSSQKSKSANPLSHKSVNTNDIPKRITNPNRNIRRPVTPNNISQRPMNPNKNTQKLTNSNGVPQKPVNPNRSNQKLINPNSVTQHQSYNRNPYQRMRQPYQNQNKTEQGGNHYEKY